jgi:hypothetical protein
MRLRIGRAETPEAIAIAEELPEGKIFATGKSLMPLMRREIYEKLLNSITLIDPKMVAKPETAAPTPATPSPFNPWDAIEVGAVVLWCADPKEGWFEATVTAVSRDKKKLTLNWRDFKGFKPFEVKRNAVGLICRIQ